MKIFKISFDFLFFILLLLVNFLLYLVFLFISPPQFALYLWSIFLIAQIFIFVFADKLLLSNALAKKLPWYSPWHSRLGNAAYHIGVKDYEVYESRFFKRQFFCFRNILGKKIFLIGEDLNLFLTEEELYSLGTLGFIRLKKFYRRRHFIWVFTWSLFSLPLFIFKNEKLRLFFRFIYFPFFFLSYFYLSKKEKIFESDRVATLHLDFPQHLGSAIYKIHKQSKDEGQLKICQEVFPFFSLSLPEESQFFSMFLGDPQYVKDRYKSLMEKGRK